MATIVQFVPTEVIADLEFPQREAAFFYGLFLRGHRRSNCEETSRCLQRSWPNGTARRSGILSCEMFFRGWWNIGGMCWQFLTP